MTTKLKLKFEELADQEIQRRGEFAIAFADKLKSNPVTQKLLTDIPFERFATIILVDCSIVLDFITMCELYDQFTEKAS